MKNFTIHLWGLMLLMSVSAVAQSVEITTIADSYVSKGNANTNYGNDTIIRIKASTTGSFDRKSYIKFDLTGQNKNYAQILLKCIKSGGEEANIEINSSATTWNEQAITWNNAPGPANAIGQGTKRVADTLFIDVTDYIKSKITNNQLTVSFELSTKDVIGSPFSLYSKESTIPENAPKLAFYDNKHIEFGSQEIELSKYITSNMVIQRDKPFGFRGFGPAGATIKVEFNREGTLYQNTAVADEDGRFNVEIPAMEFTTSPCTVTIGIVGVPESKQTLDNILIGDVWFVGGQSNMEKKVDYMLEAGTIIADADNHTDVRAFRTRYNHLFSPTDDVKSNSDPWIVANSQNVSDISAVAYTFARRINVRTGIPIGLMQAYVGGTEIETWISNDKIVNDPDLQMVEDRASGLDADNSRFYKYYHSVNYNGMVNPLRFYPIKGFLFYQGESNVKRATEYDLLLTALIEDWRSAWNMGNLPFYYVQLFNIGITDYRDYEDTANDNTWQMLREKQRLVWQEQMAPNIAMAVTIDTNEEHLNPDINTRIHPHNKKPVGERLARIALKEQYGQEVVAYSPLLETAWFENGKVFLKMKHVGEGLKIRNGSGKLSGYALAGSDGVYYKGEANIEGLDLVSVSSSEVSNPVSVAYGWSRDPICTLDNSANLPASPFKAPLQENPNGTTQLLINIGDTYAEGGSPDTAFNQTQPERILAKTGSTDQYTRIGFVKFDISELSLDDVGTAKLGMFCYKTQSTELTLDVFDVDASWDETSLTWNNKPQLPAEALATEQVKVGEYMEWSVTNYIRTAISQGKNSVAFAIYDTDGTNKMARFYTKEADEAKAPRLRINNKIEAYQALQPIEDAMVRGGASADVNYSSGTELSELIVKAGSSNPDFLRKAAFKFDLSQINPEKVSEVGTVRLKLYAFKTNNSSTSVDISLMPIGNDWNEDTVTWNTLPERLDNNPLRTTTIYPDSLNAYYEWDITYYAKEEMAKGNTTLSFSVEDLMGVNNGVTFYAKEAQNFHPMLEILEQPTDVPPSGIALSGTYYIDFTNGNDENNGTSTQTAWKTFEPVNQATCSSGTQLLFKSGEEWTGTLHIKGDGEEGNPIIIGKYGSGDKPVIHGAGAPETILLDNVAYVEVSNLEITNYNPEEEDGVSLIDWEDKNTTDWFNNTQAGNDDTSNTSKMGVHVLARDLGEVNHVYLRNLDIHGINGDNSSKNNGGIFIEITGNETPTYFNNLVVEGCHIHDVDRTGMSNVSSWNQRTLTENTNWTPSIGYKVRNNTFERTGANALILRVAVNPVIEHNLFHQSAIKGSGNSAFVFNTDGAVIQYNEARFTKANAGDEDAGGLDSDFRTKNTIIQYNYLHDNDYGMLITGGGFSTSFNDGTIVRYNIIERDGLVSRENGEKFVFKVSGQITNAVFHNNVVYIDKNQEGVDLMLHKKWKKNPKNTSYYNNIYYVRGNNHGYELGNSSGNIFSNNVFYSKGRNNTFPEDPNAISSNPRFVDAGEGPDGYKLRQNSRAIGRGTEVPIRPVMDYFQNEIPEDVALDIGAHQFNNANINNCGFELDEFDIYLLIGQSNMAGRGDIDALDQQELDNAYLFTGTDWEKASVPLNRYSTVRKDLNYQKMNPGYTFARKVSEETGKKIGLVVNARGGTSIDQWAKGYEGSKDYDLYEEAVAQLTKAKKCGVFKGILWHQGEADKNKSSSYMRKLKALVADLREDLGENTFFVAGEIGKWRSSSTNINKVIGSIENNIGQATYVKSDGLAPINGDLTDPHFDGYSQRVLGLSYADAILKNIYNLPVGVAAVYSECNFEGYKVNLGVGEYSLDELRKNGIRDNDIASIILDEGYEARFFNADGNSYLAETSDSCLDLQSIDNNITKLVIGETGTTAATSGNVNCTIPFVSPNPTDGSIIKIHNVNSLNITDTNNIRVEMVNIFGGVTQISSENIYLTSDSVLELTLSGYSFTTGVYLLKISNQSGLRFCFMIIVIK